MVRYVNLHTGFNQDMKRLLKQLTKTLIILVIIPVINQFLALLLIFFIYENQANDSLSKIIVYILLSTNHRTRHEY
uniref:Uncharacterized protein n=1 Tax=Meloidogyne enterolobii TaxID=390850 RepID=A0A6V7YB97_MELEN|nr:unnamed protein product [Meloidogyne enterolobii]